MYKLFKQPCSLQTIYIISYQYTVCRQSKKGYLIFNFALEATFSLGRGNFISIVLPTSQDGIVNKKIA